MEQIDSKVYPVVGVKFEGRQELLEKFYENYEYGSNHAAVLEKEENNEYDSNAIAVFIKIDGKMEKVGYISRNDNSELRERMDSIIESSVLSVGRNRVGDLGVSIEVKFGKE